MALGQVRSELNGVLKLLERLGISLLVKTLIALAKEAAKLLLGLAQLVRIGGESASLDATGTSEAAGAAADVPSRLAVGRTAEIVESGDETTAAPPHAPGHPLTQQHAASDSDDEAAPTIRRPDHERERPGIAPGAG